MAYSVMVWLVNPGEHPQQEQEQVRITDGREGAPGAASGVNVGYAVPRIAYGVYTRARARPTTRSRISRTSCSRTRRCASRSAATRSS